MAELLDARVLRALREAQGWDQQTLAQHAGIDPSVVSRLERGLQDDLRASVLVAFARALTTPVDSLLLDIPLPPRFDPDLTAALAKLDGLSSAQQRQIAALLRAYVATIPDHSP